MKKLGNIAFGVFFIALIIGITYYYVTHWDSRVTTRYKYTELIWGDDFIGDAVDRNVWAFEEGNGEEQGLVGWGNHELQYFFEENAVVDDGILKINVIRDNKSGYTSAKLISTDAYAVKYGRIEARIRVDAETGLWPAFWLFPNESKYGEWPRSGEIDIFEAVGANPNEVVHNIFYGTRQNNEYVYTLPGESSISDWHTYAVEWSESEIAWYVDGVKTRNETSWHTLTETGKRLKKPAPFDEAFNIILNFSVGGSFNNYKEPASDFDGAVMEVDYVRVFR